MSERKEGVGNRGADNMVILNIADIENNPYNGVCVVVPQHVNHESNFATVGFVNVNNKKIDGIESQIAFNRPFDVNSLPEPFNKPDLVVFHEVYRPCYLKIAKNLKKNKVPYIIVPHGELTAEAQKKKHLKKIAANFLLFNGFINNSAAIQCLSQREKDFTEFKKTKFIGTNGISVPEKRKTYFNSDKIDFAYIGRLEAHIKGIDLMIEAISLKKEFLLKNNCRITLYGPDLFGRGDKIREMIAERGVSELICLKNEVFGEEKEKILLDSDVFIQTSRSEGMPLGILEALSYGVPVFITEGTTLGGFVSRYDAGFVCETSAESIADMFEQIVKDRESLPEKGMHAAKLIGDNFEWDKVDFCIVEQYRNFLM